MKRISISFIIPYYNVPLPLLDRCIKSVRALGDYADWEIRFVDDGTPGNDAGNYLHALNDPRIHYYRQDNQGQGMARNVGWEQSEKEYIHFLDADDYLFTYNTLQMFNLLEKEHPDLLSFDYKKVYTADMEYMPVSRLKVRYRGNGTDYMLHHNLHGWACGYFFRKEAAGNLRFTPGILHEDEEFIPLLWLRMEKLIVTTLPVYAYYQRQDSTIHDLDERKIRKRYYDLLGILNRLRHEAGLLPDKQSHALRRRTEMVAMAMIYTLMKDSPNQTFMNEILKCMQDDGFYPLPTGRWSLLYVVFRLFTSKPSFVRLLSRWIFRRRNR